MPLSSLQTIKQEIKDKDYTIIDNNRQCRTTREIELESEDTDSQMKIKKKRKGFSKNIQDLVLQKNSNRCYITGTKLMSCGQEGASREDDHYDGDSSNNTIDNYHPLTLWAHKVKTKDQNSIIYYKNKQEIQAERESSRSFEYNMDEGYQIKHIKEISYMLESLNSTYSDIHGNKKDYSKCKDEIIELFVNAMQTIDPEIKKQILNKIK